MMAAFVGFDQTEVGIKLGIMQLRPKQLLIEAVECLPELFPANASDEVADAKVVEYRVVDGRKAEPAERNIF